MNTRSKLTTNAFSNFRMDFREDSVEPSGFHKNTEYGDHPDNCTILGK